MIEKRSRLVYGLFWIAFFNGIVATLISFYSLKSTALPESALALSYLVLQQIGHFQFFSWLLTLPLLVVVILLPVRGIIRWLAFLIFSAFLLAVYADYVIYQLYRFHFNSMIWNLLVGGAVDEILVYDWQNLIALGGAFLAVLFLQWIIFKVVNAYQNLRVQNLGKWVFVSIFLVQFSGQALHAWADAWQRREIISQVRYVPFAQPVKMKRFLRKHGGGLPALPPEASLARQADGDFKYPLKPMQCAGGDDLMNLIIIISDGLRADMLNPEVMPVWSNFAKQAQVFRRHYSSGNATRFGVFGLLSGLHGQYWFDAVSNSTTSVLMSELKRQDYRFGFFANARLTSPEFDRAIFYEFSDLIQDKTPGDSVIERELFITAKAKEFVEEKSKAPFFALVFFDAPHAYVYPAQDAKFEPALESLNYLDLDNDSDPTLFKNRYKNSIAFNDRLTAEILSSLKSSGQLDNTIVVMTGDHGQEMNETLSNSWGHNSNFSSHQLQVPMVIHWPGKKPAEFNHLSSHVDLVPTLMQEMLRCQNAIEDYSNGRSLFDNSSRDFVLSKNWNDNAIVDADYTRVFTPYGTDVFDSETYQKSESAPTLDSAQQLKVLESVSRFYQK